MLWLPNPFSAGGIRDGKTGVAMTGSTTGDFGSNRQQVARFIERVASLTPEQWSSIHDFGKYTVDYESLIPPDSDEQGGQDSSMDALMEAIESSGRQYPSTDLGATLNGVLALQNAEVLAPHRFSLLYAPFRDIIPVEELGPGEAPSLEVQQWSLYVFASDKEEERIDRREHPVTRRTELMTFGAVLTAIVGIVAVLSAAGEGGWLTLTTLLCFAILLILSLNLPRREPSG